MVNGYAGKPDSARLVNLFHVALIALNIQWWGEWVPSKANVADIMTRTSRFHELKEGLGDAKLTETALELPPMHKTVGELKDWITALKVRRAQVEADKKA